MPDIDDILLDQSHVPDHHYRTEIPNIIRELGLSPYELAVYFHIKSITGDGGKCWCSHKTLCDLIGIGETKLKECLDSLVEGTNKLQIKLLKRIKRKKENGSHDTTIYNIVDIWQTNGNYFRNKYKGVGGSPREGGVGRMAREGGSPREDKEEPSQEEHNEEDGKSSPSSNSQIKRDTEKQCFSPIDSGFITLMKDAYPHVDIELEIKRAFIKASNMEPRNCWKAFISNWCKAEESNYLFNQGSKLAKEANKEKDDHDKKLINDNYLWAVKYHTDKSLGKGGYKITWSERYVQITCKGKTYHADFIEDDFKPHFKHIISIITSGNI